MPNDMYQHLRSVAIDLLGPDFDPNSEYVRGLVELIVNATATSLDGPASCSRCHASIHHGIATPDGRWWCVGCKRPVEIPERESLDDLREDLERDLRESCEPTQPLWLVTAHLPESTFGFDWSRDEKTGRSNFLEHVRHSRPGTRVVLKRVTVPTSIAIGDPEAITDWIEAHEDDLEAFDELLAAVID